MYSVLQGGQQDAGVATSNMIAKKDREKFLNNSIKLKLILTKSVYFYTIFHSLFIHYLLIV